jgi:hypothetical protein
LRSSEDSIRWLEKRGISLGRLEYKNTGIRLVSRAVEDNPKTQEIVAEEKTKVADIVDRREKEAFSMNMDLPLIEISVPKGEAWNICRGCMLSSQCVFMCEETFNLRSRDENWITYSMEMKWVCDRSGKYLVLVHEDDVGVRFNCSGDELERDIQKWLLSNTTSNSGIPHYVWENFSWIRFLKPEFGEELDRKHMLSPLASIDPKVHDLLETFGVSSIGDTTQAKLSRELLSLRRDPDFPADLSPEMIISELSKPEINEDREKIFNVLVAMGAGETGAAKITMLINEILSNFMFAKATSGYSVTDSMYALLDMSLINVGRVLDLPDDLSTASRTLANGIGVSYLLERSFKERRRRLTFRVNPKKREQVEEELRYGQVSSLAEHITLPNAFI